MAERRMFAKTIIDSDAFLDMPLSTQALYFHLSMRADDEGFINNPRKISRMIGASDDDMRVLIAKNFIIPFESGVVVIKHWKIHNYIRGDRLKQTVYQEEAAMIAEKDNGAYTLNNSTVVSEICMSDKCQSSDSQVAVKCQHRLGKDSIGKDSIGKESIGKESICEVEPSPKVIKHKYGEHKNVLLTDDEYQKLLDTFPDADAKIEELSNGLALYGYKYKSHYLAILKWAKTGSNEPSKLPDNNQGDNIFLKMAQEEGIL